MEPEIKILPAFSVVGIKYRGKNENGEVMKLWDEFMPRVDEIKNRTQRAYGVEGNYDPATREFDYLAGFEVEAEGELPAGMSAWQVPAGSYAFFRTTLPEIISQDLMQHVYQTWLPTSGYAHSGGPDFEFYPEDFSGDQSEMYYCLPVKPA
jgi:AraC family transcriptional regulator